MLVEGGKLFLSACVIYEKLYKLRSFFAVFYALHIYTNGAKKLALLFLLKRICCCFINDATVQENYILFFEDQKLGKISFFVLLRPRGKFLLN